MPSLVEIRDAAIRELGLLLPDVTVGAISGGADAAEVLRESLGPATVLVTILSAQNTASTDSFDLDVYGQFAAIVVIYGGTGQEEREMDGLAVVDEVVHAIHGQMFGLTDTAFAQIRSIAPLDDEELERKGAWAWAVLWEQAFTLTPPAENPDESL